MNVIETSRLIIRPYQNGDAPSVFTFIMENKEHLKYVLSEQVYQANSLEDIERHLKNMRTGWILRNYLCFGIWCNGTLAGEIVLFKIDWKDLSLEMGNYISKDYQNRGIITEATIAVTQYVFQELKIKKIRAVCHMNNKAIHRVFEKCGYTIGSLSGDFIEFYTQAPG